MIILTKYIHKGIITNCICLKILSEDLFSKKLKEYEEEKFTHHNRQLSTHSKVIHPEEARKKNHIIRTNKEKNNTSAKIIVSNVINKKQEFRLHPQTNTHKNKITYQKTNQTIALKILGNGIYDQ